MKAIRCLLLGALVVVMAASMADAQCCGAGWGSGSGWGNSYAAPAWNGGGNWGYGGGNWGWGGSNRGWGGYGANWGGYGGNYGGYGLGCGAPVVCKPAKKAKKSGEKKETK